MRSGIQKGLTIEMVSGERRKGRESLQTTLHNQHCDHKEPRGARRHAQDAADGQAALEKAGVAEGHQLAIEKHGQVYADLVHERD